MATLDLSTAESHPTPAARGAGTGASGPGDREVLLTSESMTFETAGRPTSGTTAAVEIDLIL